MRYKTNNIFGNFPIIQLWDYNSEKWEGGYGSVEEAIADFYTLTGDVLDSTDHIQDGVVQMRIYKASNGNTQNEYYVDMLAIADGYATPSGNVDLSPYWRKGNIEETGNFITSGDVTANKGKFIYLNVSGDKDMEARIEIKNNNLTINDGESFVGVLTDYAITGGTAGVDEDFTAYKNYFLMNHSGGEIDQVLMHDNFMWLTDGTIFGDVYSLKFETQQDGGLFDNDLRGIAIINDLNAGTIGDYVRPIYVDIDQEAGHTNDYQAEGIYIKMDLDGTSSSVDKLGYFRAYNNVEYGLYLDGDYIKYAIALDGDNSKLAFGEDADWWMYWDGTNPIFNQTVNGVYTFYNSTGLGQIRVGDILYSTPEFSNDMSTLENMKNPADMIMDGKTDKEFHESFPTAIQKQIDVRDDKNCWEVCLPILEGEEEAECYQECGTKKELVISGGLGYLDNYNLIYELNEEVKELELSLCLSNPIECVMEKGIKYIVERVVSEK